MRENAKPRIVSMAWGIPKGIVGAYFGAVAATAAFELWWGVTGIHNEVYGGLLWIWVTVILIWSAPIGATVGGVVGLIRPLNRLHGTLAGVAFGLALAGAMVISELSKSGVGITEFFFYVFVCAATTGTAGFLAASRLTYPLRPTMR